MENNNIQNNNIDLEKHKINIENKTNQNKQIIITDKFNENSNKETDLQNEITPETNIGDKNNIAHESYLEEKNNIDHESYLEEKSKKIKYRMNFSVMIDYLRDISYKNERSEEIEFNSNILLMSSKINQSNKISCLSLLSFINHHKSNALYIYYLNKKIYKYLQIQKGIESYIYIRTLYRAAFFLEQDKNYFYAYKYLMKAAVLCENSKIITVSKQLLKILNNKILEGLRTYGEKYVKKFRDIDNPSNLNKENYDKLKKLFKLLKENNYENKINNKIKENNENKNQDEYLYVINKKWVEKAYFFLKDYINVRDNHIKGDYFRTAFMPDNFYHSYFEDDTKNEKETKSEKDKKRRRKRKN